MWPVNIIGIFPEAVIAGFVSYVECDQHHCGKTDGEAEDVYDAEKLMTQDVAPGGGDVVRYKHNLSAPHF